MCANLHSTHASGGMRRLLYWEATKDFQDCNSDQDLAAFSCRPLCMCVYVPVCACVCVCVCACLCVCVLIQRLLISLKDQHTAGAKPLDLIFVNRTHTAGDRGFGHVCAFSLSFHCNSIIGPWQSSLLFSTIFFNFLKTFLLYRLFHNLRPDRSSRQKRSNLMVGFKNRYSICFSCNSLLWRHTGVIIISLFDKNTSRQSIFWGSYVQIAWNEDCLCQPSSKITCPSASQKALL